MHLYDQLRKIFKTVNKEEYMLQSIHKHDSNENEAVNKSSIVYFPKHMHLIAS